MQQIYTFMLGEAFSLNEELSRLLLQYFVTMSICLHNLNPRKDMKFIIYTTNTSFANVFNSTNQSCTGTHIFVFVCRMKLRLSLIDDTIMGLLSIVPWAGWPGRNVHSFTI